MRPRLAGRLVRSLLSEEGFPPERVVVVVNEPGGLDPPELEGEVRMVRLPTNLGPAGGFLVGLAEAFSSPRTRWAYMCEDDALLLGLELPRLGDLVERATAAVVEGVAVGTVTATGRRLDPLTGHGVNVVPPADAAHGLAPVDVSTWGAVLVSRAVYDLGVAPDASLFFGYEDYDFYCRVRRAGLQVLVDVRSARQALPSQTQVGRNESFSGHRPADADEPWRAYYVARNFFHLARAHGRRSWVAWHLLFSVRRLQLAPTPEARRAVLRGLWHGLIGRRGEEERYVRAVGELPAELETAEPVALEPTPQSLAPQVLAMVLTHNAPSSLARCLAAIGAQERPPQAVLVVDNASEPPVDASTLAGIGTPVRVVRSETNTGPAGGWAIAFAEFLSGGFDHAWVMDDDMVPDPACLRVLWRAAEHDPTSAFLFPRAIQPDGTVGEWGSWCGFLVARQVVEKAGVPRADFFWWAEDNEYCHVRIPAAGFSRRIVDGALVEHLQVRRAGGVPPWKYYYEARNMLYLHLHVMRRLGWYPRNVTRLLARAVVRERGRRPTVLAALARGLYDGATGRMGMRFPVTPLRESGSETAAG